MTANTANPDRLPDLVRLLLDEEIDAAGVSELAGLLQDSPRAIEQYLNYLSLDAELAWECGRSSHVITQTQLPGPPLPAERGTSHGKRFHRWLLPTVAATLVAIAVLIVAVFRGEKTAALIAAPVLTLDYVSGHVRLVDDGRVLQPLAGTRLSSNVKVTTTGSRSMTRLAYDDGSRVLVSGQSVVEFAGSGQKQLRIRQGAITANVVPQPAGLPMSLLTQQTRIEIPGTSFSLAASSQRTAIQVSRGSLRLARTAGGQSVIVPQGKRAEAEDHRPGMTIRDSREIPDTWEEDFENGPSVTWDLGRLVDVELPSGSRGGLRAEQDETSRVFGVSSPHPWLDGLFVTRADSHLHITFQMSHPDWINVFLITRTHDPVDPATTLYRFNGIPTSPPDSGVWRTTVIPLSHFQKLTPEGFDGGPPTGGEVLFGLSCNSPAPDRGLVIDRIRVTRGGSGRFVIQNVD